MDTNLTQPIVNIICLYQLRISNSKFTNKMYCIAVIKNWNQTLEISFNIWIPIECIIKFKYPIVSLKYTLGTYWSEKHPFKLADNGIRRVLFNFKLVYIILISLYNRSSTVAFYYRARSLFTRTIHAWWIKYSNIWTKIYVGQQTHT